VPPHSVIDVRLLQATCDDMRTLGVVQDRVDAQQSVDLRSIREAAGRLT
jgi:hypothetical protein